MTFRGVVGDNFPHNATKCQMKTQDFLATHPVFSLEEAHRALQPPGGKSGTVERLKHYLETGRLKLVGRGVYATVPPGVAPDQFQPDPLLVGAAARPEGVFSFHSALDLLGAAHSVWRQHTLFVNSRRSPLRVDSMVVRFLEHPSALAQPEVVRLGTQNVEHRGRLLRTTGPERTLVEGFRRPGLAGGVEELVESAAGFPVLDLDLLEAVLQRYGVRRLWGAVGWFLERFQERFHVPPGVLESLETKRPKAPQYLLPGTRGGELAARWGVILPSVLTKREPNEP